jgi:hypothetical protein
VVASQGPSGELRNPERWAETARALAEAGDPAALTELVKAYDWPVEGDKVSLLEAMEALGGAEEAHRMIESADPIERRIGVRLMQLVPDGRHLEALERLVADDDEVVGRFARRALETQWRTAEWRAIVERLMRSENAEVRTAAESWLS